MKFLRRSFTWLIGQNAKFGTLANLFREMVVGVGAAVAVTLLIDRFLPAPASPVAEAHALAADLLRRQHVADSTIDAVKCEQLSTRIDSLRRIVVQHELADSLRAANSAFDIPKLPLQRRPW